MAKEKSWQGILLRYFELVGVVVWLGAFAILLPILDEWYPERVGLFWFALVLWWIASIVFWKLWNEWGVTLMVQSQLPASEKRKRGVQSWHPGKIALLWVIDLAVFFILWLLYQSYEKAEAVIVWLILSIPVFALTWRWLSRREGRS